MKDYQQVVGSPPVIVDLNVCKSTATRVDHSPGELAKEAWNTEKLMRAYEARKKLEMIGAMTFSCAGEAKRNHREDQDSRDEVK